MTTEVFYDLQLTKDGKLNYKHWIPRNKKQKGHFEIIDKTDNPYSVLHKTVSMESGFTLQNLFDIVRNDSDILNVICHNCYITSYINYYEQLLEQNYEPAVSEYSNDNIEFIELYWYEEIYDGYLDTSFKANCHGIGWELKEDRNEEWGTWPKGSRITWAIDFTDLSKLLHLPIKLNEQFNIYEHGNKEKQLLNAKRKYTLYDVIVGVFWELSFNGTPEDTKKLYAELKAEVDDIREKK